MVKKHKSESYLERERTALSRVIKEKKEDLVTECYADPDFDAGTMVFTSVESGELVHERPLTNAERQMNLIDMENSADSQND